MVDALLHHSNNAVFGHIAGLNEDVPARQPLHAHVNLSLGRPPDSSWKRRPGRPCCRWIDQIRKDNDMAQAGYVLNDDDYDENFQKGPKLPLLWNVPMLKTFQLHDGLCTGPRWGLRPQTPIIPSRSALAMCPPHTEPSRASAPRITISPYALGEGLRTVER